MVEYARNFWSALKIHPDPDVSLNGTHIILPIQIPVTPIFDFDREPSELFLDLAAQLQRPDSGLLIQNICTALEAFAKTTRKGDTGNQVCQALVKILPHK